MQGGNGTPVGENGERGTIPTKLRICVPPMWCTVGEGGWAHCGRGGGVVLLEMQ